jgi:hypothetical protein
MAKKTPTPREARKSRQALRTLSIEDLASAVGGLKPGQYGLSSGGGGGQSGS